MPMLRRHSAGARPVSPDRPRTRQSRTAGPYRGGEVRRSSAALPLGRDLRSGRRGPGHLDPVGLGEGDGSHPPAANRSAPPGRPGGLGCPLRRRHPRSSAGAAPGPDEDRAVLGLCVRRAAPQWYACAGCRVPGHPPTARASGRWRIWPGSRVCCTPDGYAGFNRLYEGARPGGALVEAASAGLTPGASSSTCTLRPVRASPGSHWSASAPSMR
jgi:hypothetical protein